VPAVHWVSGHTNEMVDAYLNMYGSLASNVMGVRGSGSLHAIIIVVLSWRIIINTSKFKVYLDTASSPLVARRDTR